jgi:hypothetical protein
MLPMRRVFCAKTGGTDNAIANTASMTFILIEPFIPSSLWAAPKRRTNKRPRRDADYS